MLKTTKEAAGISNRKLSGDVNSDLLGPPGDSEIILFSESDEDEHENDHADVDAAPSSLRVLRAPSAFATDDDSTLDQV
jgi:hypothetical protein